MDFSIIIPTRNEGTNVETVADRILKTLGDPGSLEILFVDDSTDDTPEILERLSRRDSRVKYVHRQNGSGLGTAVLEGFRRAAGKWFIVMDADLQHPPETLSDVIREIRKAEADIIIPSRFVPGGSDGGLSPWRKLVSWTARSMARVLLSKVRPVTDPTSGFFAVRSDVAGSAELNPVGWKILLEVLVRCRYSRVVELPYAFQARMQGDSKFNVKEQWHYLLHLLRLVRASEADFRFWKFCMVGAGGVLVNFAVYVPLVKLGLSVGFAYAAATLTAILNNFTWNNLLTWPHLKNDRLWYRMFKFFTVSLGGLAISSLAVTVSHDWLGLHYLISGMLGIAITTGWNFYLNNVWTFGGRAERAEGNAPQAKT